MLTSGRFLSRCGGKSGIVKPEPTVMAFEGRIIKDRWWYGVGTIEQDIAKKTGLFSAAQKNSCCKARQNANGFSLLKTVAVQKNKTLSTTKTKQLGKPVTDVSGLLFSARTTYLLAFLTTASKTYLRSNRKSMRTMSYRLIK